MEGWTREDVLALLGVVATVAVAVGGPVLGFMLLARNGLNRLLGRSGRRYRSWFIAEYRVVYNVYLRERSELDLGTTYVALSAVGEDADGRRVATEVMGDADSRRLVITGDPGSGKSTLLKAYGVAICRPPRTLADRSDLWHIRRGKETPFFVPLRRFAEALDRGGDDLGRFLVEEILVRRARFPRGQAEAYLAELLKKGGCLILADGLDEVPDDKYERVRNALYAFAENGDPDNPTENARIIVTCRRQNLIGWRGEWIPRFAAHEHTLNPLRDTEILRYLDNLRPLFAEPQSPEAFFGAVRESAETLDLHRTPLILAMSVGLYLSRRPRLDIPDTTLELYGQMVAEMLKRHDFTDDPVAKSNRFQARDKERFLREFALEMAERDGAFEDFTRAELVAAARRLAPSLREVREAQAEDFVKEIFDRSGLLADVGDDANATFAHRSIQEYLAAVQLHRLPDGAERLLARAGDRAWRLVTLFYAAGDQPQIGEFLERLAGRDLDLAVRCLAGADTDDVNALGVRILDAYAPEWAGPADIEPVLTAILQACRSPRAVVRDRAVAHAESLLLGVPDHALVGWLGGDENLLRVLGAVAGTSTARIASLMPRFSGGLADDPRLVPILWQCLASPGIERQPAVAHILQLLLDLAVDPDGFAELERQPAYAPSFLTELRRRAYPFDRALPHDHNLVTLLAWAHHIGVAPSRPSRFFEAADAAHWFEALERDERRGLRFSLFPFARWTSITATVCSLALVALTLATDPGPFLEPFGWRTPAVLVGVSVSAALGVLGLAVTGEERPEIPEVLGPAEGDAGRLALGWMVGWIVRISSSANPYLDVYRHPTSAHWLGRRPGEG
ncbi:hypothetical protein [Actinocorallia sp. A-T 12471]|uniref:NACHT domain-containing protein n=1 Tax=Actinocorallia sp. A-T 12471 TaxID=3089813 RepID=UPI0029CC128F|nr:hypothetical protein [Actinocorallia sp. A-T 12471]MDX6744264.1 hypothetical protein [Actinocorallia sp. A-T 12471]